VRKIGNAEACRNWNVRLVTIVGIRRLNNIELHLREISCWNVNHTSGVESSSFVPCKFGDGAVVL